MKVLVLAAGRSKRMAPVADKNFLDFAGKTLIRRQLEMVTECGFSEAVVVGGAHNIERLDEEAQKVVGLHVEVVEQKDLDAGMCGAVLAAKDFVAGNPVLVFSSNDVVDKKAFELVRDCEGSCIIGKKVESYFPGGYLKVEDGVIKGIVEKPGAGNEPSDMVNLVVHWHQDGTKLIEYLEAAKSESDDLYEVALDQMIKDGEVIKAIPYDGFWQPIKFPWHVMPVFRHFMSKEEKAVAESAQIAESAVLKGEVIVAENVKIFEGAVINGPAYIGEGSVIANNALVRDSQVGAGCVIGFSSEVARSYLGSEVWTHSNYIGDSVIGNNVSFGAGTVTGNLRLDEKNIAVNCDGNSIDTGVSKFGLVTGDNVRCGINVSFMPGVKIGGGSFIGAGIVVAQDIEKNSFVRGSFELKISENKGSAGERDDFKNKL